MAPIRPQQPTLERQRTESKETVEVNKAMSQVQVRDEDSDSDEGGIQMLDNDDGDMMHLPSEPIPDDDREPQHPHGQPSSSSASRVEVQENQKFLGSFSRDKGKKVTASEMGLY